MEATEKDVTTIQGDRRAPGQAVARVVYLGEMVKTEGMSLKRDLV